MSTHPRPACAHLAARLDACLVFEGLEKGPAARPLAQRVTPAKRPSTHARGGCAGEARAVPDVGDRQRWSRGRTGGCAHAWVQCIWATCMLPRVTWPWSTGEAVLAHRWWHCRLVAPCLLTRTYEHCQHRRHRQSEALMCVAREEPSQRVAAAAATGGAVPPSHPAYPTGAILHRDDLAGL